MKKRIPQLDILRGIGICLIVLSHSTNTDERLRLFLFSFHVPLFFILSGYLYNGEKRYRVKIWKRVVGWLAWYVGLSVIDMGCLYLFLPQSFNAETLVRGWLCMDNQLIFNTPKWFLLVLAEVELLYGLIYSQKLYVKLVICLVCAMFGYVVRDFWPFGLHVLFVAWVFFTVGDMLKKVPLSWNRFNVWLKPISVFAVVLLYILAVKNGYVTLLCAQYGNNYLLFWINAFLGTLACLLFSLWMGQNHLLEFMGCNSMYILCLHYYLMRGAFPMFFPGIYDTMAGKLICTVATLTALSAFIWVFEQMRPRLRKSTK